MEALQNGKYFLSCDWGTSNFRLQLIDKEKLLPVASEVSEEGIGGVFKAWQSSGGKERFAFYHSIIQQHIALLERKAGFSLQNVPLVVSGMVSASVGMKELPYKLMPFAVDGSDLKYEISGNILIISGARTADDVMRGEETQVVGIADMLGNKEYIILPGTHSKHVQVADGRAVSVQTFMTGETFQVFAQHSLIATSIRREGSFAEFSQFFAEGVQYSQEHNFLNSIFSVRTNVLLSKLSPGQNYYYLSGLIIGEELKNLPAASVHLVGSAAMNELYARAIQLIKPDVSIKPVPAGQAIVRGQYKVLAAASKTV